MQQFSIDLQQERIRNRAHFQEYFVQDDWRLSNRVTVNAGLRYTLNFPSTEKNDQAAVFNLADAGSWSISDATAIRGRRASCTRPTSGLASASSAASPTGPCRATGYGAGLDRAWPASRRRSRRRSFPFLQTVSQRTLDNIAPAFVLANGPERRADPAHAGRGHRAGRLLRRSRSRLRLRPAVECVGAARAHVEHRDRGRLCRLEDHACRHSRHEPESADRRSARAGSAAAAARAESVLRHDPAVLVARRSDDSRSRSCSSRFRSTRPSASIATTSARRSTTAFYAKLEQRFSRGLSYLGQLHAIEADRRCVVGVRCVDPHRAGRQLSRSPTASIGTSSATTRPATSRTCSSHRRCGKFPSATAGASAGRRARRDRERLDADRHLTLQSGVPIAVTQATNFNAFAGFGTQRPNLVGDPNCRRTSDRSARWFNTAAFVAAPQFTLGTSSRNPVRGPGYRNVDLAMTRRVPLRGEQRARTPRRGLQPDEHAAAWRAERHRSGRRRSERSRPPAIRGSFSSERRSFFDV